MSRKVLFKRTAESKMPTSSEKIYGLLQMHKYDTYHALNATVQNIQSFENIQLEIIMFNVQCNYIRLILT